VQHRPEPAYSWAPPPPNSGYFPALPNLSHLGHANSDPQVPRIINQPYFSRTPSNRSAPYYIQTASPRLPQSQGSSTTASPATAMPRQIAYNQQDE
jgi:hypothetical protein